MTFKFRFKVGGGHTHIRVFSGKDADHLGKCGDLTMTNEEWAAFREITGHGEGYLFPAGTVIFTEESESGSHDRLIEERR